MPLLDRGSSGQLSKETSVALPSSCCSLAGDSWEGDDFHEGSVGDKVHVSSQKNMANPDQCLYHKGLWQTVCGDIKSADPLANSDEFASLGKKTSALVSHAILSRSLSREKQNNIRNSSTPAALSESGSSTDYHARGRKLYATRHPDEISERIKQDAKIAALVAIRKQADRGEEVAGLRIFENMNIMNIHEEYMEQNSSWRKRRLLGMVESIVHLFALHRTADGGSL